MAMRMTKIYRLEHPVTGRGVFSSVGKADDVKKALSAIFDVAGENRHPSPLPDMTEKYKLSTWDSSYYCACPDMDSLRKWFSGNLLETLIKEFHLLEITVPKKLVLYGKSGIQACYRKEDIVSVNYIITL